MLRKNSLHFYRFRDPNTVTASVTTIPSPSSVREMLMNQRQKAYNNNNTNLHQQQHYSYSSPISSSSPSSSSTQIQQHQSRQLWSQNYDENTGAPVDQFCNQSVLPRFMGKHAKRPFIGRTIEDYTSRYWCVKFTYMSNVHENREMQRYVSWYAVKCKVVYLDYLPFTGSQIRDEVAARMRSASRRNGSAPAIPGTEEAATLPALFVNNKLVGNLATLRTLEDSGRLKDVLQFGFLWHSRPDAGPDVIPEALPVPPSLYGDEGMFRGQWRGAPVATPVVELPKYLPRDSITYGRSMGDSKPSHKGKGN